MRIETKYNVGDYCWVIDHSTRYRLDGTSLGESDRVCRGEVMHMQVNVDGKNNIGETYTIAIRDRGMLYESRSAEYVYATEEEAVGGL